MAGQVKLWGPEALKGREEGGALNRTARGVKVGLLTRLTTETGQLPKDMSARTIKISVQLVLVRLVKPVKQLKPGDQGR